MYEYKYVVIHRINHKLCITCTDSYEEFDDVIKVIPYIKVINTLLSI